ncbi:transposase, partial [Streptomyces sp. SID685]|uniref:transposase n=1 Tax=Streptomyces sp. SID685 TaxID=2690322 RepID=UPI001F2BD2E2
MGTRPPRRAVARRGLRRLGPARRASGPLARPTGHRLRFLLGLSDRQAAEAVRCRIDFKYAMAMELDDPGFHHSVMADFRGRLTEDDRADRLLGRLKDAGLVRESTTQRTDSIHVHAAVRDLTRLELITEAVRAALEENASTAGHLLDALVDEEWGRGYGRPVRLGRTPPSPRPGSSPPATTPSCSWNTSTETGKAGRSAPASRPCARSWCRTTTVTPPDACSGALPRTTDRGCRPRPGRSSRPTTPRPATHGTDTSSAGEGSPLIYSTICVSGWTATVRPPTSYTNPLKAQGFLGLWPPGMGGIPAGPAAVDLAEGPLRIFRVVTDRVT